MKKYLSYVLTAMVMLIGTNAWGATYNVGTTDKFEEAWAAAGDNVIKLTDNVALTKTMWLGTENLNDAARSIEIDLNGNDLSSSATYAFMLTHGSLKISNGQAALGGKLIGGNKCTNVFYITGSTNKDVDPSKDDVSYFTHLEIAEGVIVSHEKYDAAISVDGIWKGGTAWAANANSIPTKPALTYITNVYATGEDVQNKCAANGVRLDIKGTINGQKYGVKTNGYLGCPSYFYEYHPATGHNLAFSSSLLPAGYQIEPEDTKYSAYVHIHPTGRVTVLANAPGGQTKKPVGIYAAGYARWKIEGYAEGGVGACVKSGDVDISDATIVGTGSSYNPAEGGGSGTAASGSAIVIESSNAYSGDIDVNIGGDTDVKATNGYAVDESVTDAEGTKVETITITGGSFQGGSVPVDPENPSAGTTQGTIKVTQETAENVNTEITVTGGQIYGDDDAVQIGNQNLADFLADDVDAGTTHITFVDDGNGGQTMIVMEGEAPTAQEIVANWPGESVEWAHALPGDKGDMTETISADLELTELQIIGDYSQTLTIATGNTLEVGRVVLGSKAKIIVQPGAIFKVTGEQGIKANKTSNIILETNDTKQATFLFNPAVTSNRHPKATVKYIPTCYQTSRDPWAYVYQRFALPIMEGVAPGNDFSGTLYPGEVSFYTRGWEWDGLKWNELTKWSSMKPFVGYQIANSSKDGGVTYTFEGELIGNIDGAYNFKTTGFYFFGNSYTGAIHIETLLEGFAARNPGMEITVWPYNSAILNWDPITLETIDEGSNFINDLKAMDGFVLRLASGSKPGDVNYKDAIWNNPLYAGGSPAPARAAATSINNSVKIYVSAEGSEMKDVVTLVEKAERTAAFENGADATKYMNESGMNLYAETPAGTLSRVSTNNIEGTQITFDAIDAEVYTLSFNFVNGSDYALRDNLTGTVIALEDGATYTFQQAANSSVQGRFEVVSIEKVATAVETAQVTNDGKGIYTILGQYVGEKAAWNNLPAGIYVVDGVKMVK